MKREEMGWGGRRELLVGDKGGEGRGCANMKNKGLICEASETYGGEEGGSCPPPEIL